MQSILDAAASAPRAPTGAALVIDLPVAPIRALADCHRGAPVRPGIEDLAESWEPADVHQTSDEGVDVLVPEG